MIQPDWAQIGRARESVSNHNNAVSMPITHIPPSDPRSSEDPASSDSGYPYLPPWDDTYLNDSPEPLPHRMLELQDQLDRSRRRQAIWFSIIGHLTIVVLMVNGPRLANLLPRRAVVALSPNDMTRQKDLTYLEMPPDLQKVERPKSSDIISDKDRIAMSKHPQLDAKQLKKILDSSRPGRPGVPSPPAQPQPNQAPQAAQNAGASGPQGAQPQPPPPASSEVASLQQPTPPKQKPQVNFGGSMSAGSAIEQAARAALANRGGGYGGEGGDYGLGQGQRGQMLGNMEVLSDTMGVDFGPYLQRVLQNVRQNWYLLIPEVARPPIMKKGKVAIEFAILKNGSVSGMQRVSSSGDIALDRAAWAGITNSNPFPPLPSQFGGQYLGLRFYFYYNPEKNEMQ